MGSFMEASLACFMDSPPQHLAGMNISAGMAAGGSAVERNRAHAAHAAKVLVRPLRAQHVAANPQPYVGSRENEQGSSTCT